MDSPQYSLMGLTESKLTKFGFKPYYKWIVLNTPPGKIISALNFFVLNLIINGQSSIHNMIKAANRSPIEVLNLIINGQSSIPTKADETTSKFFEF